ncbi:MAG: hypothetical protein FWD77_09625 [Betaproteobacteria bacterium]|nr:hypothetical protein [Betaproteobacteria bacterium]
MKQTCPNALGDAALLAAPFIPAMSGAPAYRNPLGIVRNDVCRNSNNPDGDRAGLNPASLCNLTMLKSASTMNIDSRQKTPDTVEIKNNNVIVREIADEVYGALLLNLSNAAVTANQLSVVGADAEAVLAIGGAANVGDGGYASATGNAVIIDRGGKVSEVTGGRAYASTSANGNAKATGNRVAILDGEMEHAIGGDAECGDNGSAEALNNTVSISGGTVGIPGFMNKLFGGNASLWSGICTASNNIVSISGGTITNLFIYGGHAQIRTSSGACIASNNTVEIGENAVIGPGVTLYGGAASRLWEGGSATSTGNILKLALGGVTVDGMACFQKLDFRIPANLGNKAMLIVNNSEIGRLANLGAGAQIGVAVEGKFKPGERIVLIQAEDLQGVPDSKVKSMTSGYAFKIVDSELANNKLVVEVTAAPQTAPC